MLALVELPARERAFGLHAWRGGLGGRDDPLAERVGAWALGLKRRLRRGIGGLVKPLDARLVGRREAHRRWLRRRSRGGGRRFGRGGRRARGARGGRRRIGGFVFS